MRVLVKLSGEHPTMPLSEAAAICGAEASSARDLGGGVFLIRGGTAARVASRAGLSHWAGDILGEADDIGGLPAVDLAGAGYRFDVKGCPGSEVSAARAAGIRLVRDGRVDLTSPARRLMLHRSDRWRLLDVHRQQKGFSERSPVRRPFFNPISIMPRLARALVNMTRTPDGGAVLDPMCGTGGLLIEAGLVGYRLLASDADPAMAEGTARNLASLGLCAETAVLPVADAPGRWGRVDGIVTDPPYGKASTTLRKGRDNVLDEAMAASAEMLGAGSRIALAVPDPAMLDGCEADFVREESHAMRIHGTLTRHFTVLRRR